jgi:hypothetical protein
MSATEPDVGPADVGAALELAAAGGELVPVLLQAASAAAPAIVAAVAITVCRRFIVPPEARGIAAGRVAGRPGFLP